MTLVVDSSAVVAALVDDGPDGEWASAYLRSEPLAAPAHMLIEVSNVLRRSVLADSVSRDVAALAHEVLPGIRVTTFGFPSLAARVWALHPTVTAYDAAYVALAEELDVPLLTLDRRLVRASGPTCVFLTPPE
ncbi:type II toxin-antitoxin system VapC family toxin [Blastococcus capsensis]|uniref:type II toxin-antitoxin system VapC family toxin n=1 Tax=Blastococcus capsensis TaxID=1564163 RepID=UPI0025404661|nr:type II toxin-antitoxin system VapC family toxin [Blastococcus capsensis]MDK3256548.1 type II toxin-antitoxin system VapC family toxin [Blastococcus capsensis]